MYAEIDPHFSTGYDQLVARFKANDMFSDYIRQSIESLHDNPSSLGKNFSSEFTWTAPIAALAELIVALDAHAAFNNSPIGIGKLAVFFAKTFGVKLTNIHKTYEEIRLRKKNRTVFLDALKLSLQRVTERREGSACSARRAGSLNDKVILPPRRGGFSYGELQIPNVSPPPTIPRQ